MVIREEPVAIFAVENQECRDYRMPVRCMRYDADEYERQIKAFEAEQKSVSIIFRPGKAISLLPVLTIVLYYGQGGMDGSPQTVRNDCFSI